MSAVTGVVHSVHTLKGAVQSPGPVELVEILFTLEGTYVQNDNGILAGISTLIANSRRNGKSYTVLGAAPSQTATKQSALGEYMGLKTVAVSSADLTFEVTENSPTTELAAGAMPAQSRPFGLVVAVVEA